MFQKSNKWLPVFLILALCQGTQGLKPEMSLSGDAEIKYINLTTNRSYQVDAKEIGDHVQWVVYVDASPPPTLKWLNPRGYVIRGSQINPNSSKYVTVTSPTFASLRINNLGMTDTGDYSLQASNGDESKTVHFRLRVLAKPMMKLDRLSPFYMLQYEVNIFGEVKALPLPNITCTFLEAPNYPNLTNTHLVSLEVSDSVNDPVANLNNMGFRKIGQAPKHGSIGVVTFTTEYRVSETGLLNCTACNTVGCDSKVHLLYVSDLPLGSDFEVFGPNIRIMVGDDVIITCAISIYNYISVEWLDEGDVPLRENQQVSTTSEETQFSNRTHLYIKNVEKDKNGTNYDCRALTRDGVSKIMRYELVIYDHEKPCISETNMKKIPIILDLSSDKNKTVFLSCYAKAPMPTITWYKDNTRIECSERYICLNQNQELHIKQFRDKDGGNYTCTAENRAGKDYKYQIVVMKEMETPKVLIISIVVVVVICVILVVGISIKVHRKKVMRKEMETGLTHFMEGALESLNPKLTVGEQAELLPYQQKWEFPRERLDIGKQLGSGAFGLVVKAKAWGICHDESVTTVAVKKVKNSTDSICIRALATELKIMVHLGKHLNIVNLLGACTKNIPKCELLVIVEYCPFGNLQMYLLKHRTDFINQIDPTSGKLDPKTTRVESGNSLRANSCKSIPDAEIVSYTTSTDYQSNSELPDDGYILSSNSTHPSLRSSYGGDSKDHILKPICTQDLVSWAFQVARGMEYLSQRKVLHGDLAARNILLAENNVVKISDFAKTIYKNSNYNKKTNTPLSVKWMAIESIKDRVFSTQSDIWSFGIVLWEFFTLAETPYRCMGEQKQYKKLLSGYRMKQPKYATKEMYDIMLQCWNSNPTLRPTFTNLVTSIGNLLEESVKSHYEDLNAPYLDLNRKALESEKNDYLILMSAPDYEVITSATSLYVKSPC